MSVHENKKVSIHEIEMALEKNVNHVNEREDLLESCKQWMQEHKDPLNMLQKRHYREVVGDAISLANGTISKETIIRRIKSNDSLISINFISITQANYQLEKIIAAINTKIDKFIGKECIIHCSCYHDEELTPKFDKKSQAVLVYVEFINTKKGRAQLEKLRKTINAELDNFEEKGLMGSYNSNDRGMEKDLTSGYTREKIQDIEKKHQVQISIY